MYPLVGATKNYKCWEKVFPMAYDESKCKLNLHHKSPMIHEAAAPTGFPQEFSILGVFETDDGMFAAVTFTIDGSWDSVSDVKTEIEHTIEALSFIPEDQKDIILAVMG